VVAALVTGSAQIAARVINNLFRLFREKRKKGTYEAFSLHIHNTYFLLADDTEASVKTDIDKMIEDAGRRSAKRRQRDILVALCKRKDRPHGVDLETVR